MVSCAFVGINQYTDEIDIGTIKFLIMEFLIRLAFLVIGILITRALGAWMLRINDVIKYQKEILEELRRIKGD